METSIVRNPSAVGAGSRLLRPAVRVLRAVIFVHASLVFAQAVLAGQFLSGSTGALAIHEMNGTGIIPFLALVQLLVAVVVWRPGRGPAWPALASAALFVAEGFQMRLGFEGELAVHIPLGVSIFGATIVLLMRTRHVTAN